LGDVKGFQSKTLYNYPKRFYFGDSIATQGTVLKRKPVLKKLKTNYLTGGEVA